jgi:tetraacyldisaccharide 4'-kinase
MSLTHTYIKQVMSGQARGPAAAITRAALRLCEPFYAAVVSDRNRLFDRGIRKSRTLPRPVISVGNITTGGTGKTPMVRWIVEQLQQRGVRPAVLMRGYKSRHAAGDEQLMLRAMLPGVPIEAHANRAIAAKKAMNETSVDCFVLDDAFQHRQIARDFDLVLINALCPFGWNHVLPRGMLRERLPGLRRASAFVITRADQASPDDIQSIEQILRRYNSSAPIFRANHALSKLRDADGKDLELAELTRQPFFAFAGIANPEAFDQQLRAMGAAYLGGNWLGDHAAYDDALMQSLQASAREIGARTLVTTEKDWVKIQNLKGAREGLPIRRIDVAIEFQPDDGSRLIEQISAAIHKSQ